MVAQTAEAPNAHESDEAWAHDSASDWHRANRGGLRRLVASTVRLADLQLKIWLTQAKMTATRVVTFIVLFAIAAVMAILGTIFLFIGLFRVLTDVVGLRPVWAFLVFALFAFSVAGIVLMIAQKSLGQKTPEHDKTTKPLPEKPR